MSLEIKQHAAAEPISVDEQFDSVDWQANRALFTSRVKIFPKRVKGTFRTIKWAFLVALLSIYYLLPWLRWDRGPIAPDQAILFDIGSRRFYFFDIEIWPQEIIFLVGILICCAFGLFMVTSIIGRAWCAWGCPQSVWTDLFMLVERKIEGDRNARIKLDAAPWTGGKLAKRAMKHSIWLFIAMGTGGAWTFYFMDAPTLAQGILTLDAPAAAWITIGILTFTTYMLAGHAREQVCTYMCPYSRFQSVMMDKETWTISYKADRGEPRGKYKQGDIMKGRGHCIDCTQCVAVCPMGIDIRKGMQIECINCGLCADACNNVMDKVGFPRDLIGFDNLHNVERRARGEDEAPFTVLRVRTFIYIAALTLVLSAMIGGLMTRSDVGLTVIKDRNPIFVTLSNGDIRNGYTVKILNKRQVEDTYILQVEGIEGITITEAGRGHGIFGNQLSVTIAPDAVEDFRIFVKVPADYAPHGQTPIRFSIDHGDGDQPTIEKTSFAGPESR